MSDSVTSPARIHRFNVCPRRFWFQDVRGLELAPQHGPTLAVGNAVHDALARSFRLPPEKRTADGFENLLRLVWPRHRKHSFDDVQQEREHGLEAVRMVRAYADRTDLTVSPAAIERTLDTQLDGKTIRGRIDRVDRLADGTHRIVDYKTGRHVLDHDDLRRNPAARIYLLLAEAKIGPVSEIRFEYLAADTSVVWQPERDDLEFIAESVICDLDGIWDRRHYEPVTGRHCHWCPYRTLCADGWAATETPTANSGRGERLAGRPRRLET